MRYLPFILLIIIASKLEFSQGQFIQNLGDNPKQYDAVILVDGLVSNAEFKELRTFLKNFILSPNEIYELNPSIIVFSDSTKELISFRDHLSMNDIMKAVLSKNFTNAQGFNKQQYRNTYFSNFVACQELEQYSIDQQVPKFIITITSGYPSTLDFTNKILESRIFYKQNITQYLVQVGHNLSKDKFNGLMQDQNHLLEIQDFQALNKNIIFQQLSLMIQSDCQQFEEEIIKRKQEEEDELKRQEKEKEDEEKRKEEEASKLPENNYPVPGNYSRTFSSNGIDVISFEIILVNKTKLFKHGNFTTEIYPYRINSEIVGFYCFFDNVFTWGQNVSFEINIRDPLKIMNSDIRYEIFNFISNSQKEVLQRCVFNQFTFYNTSVFLENYNKNVRQSCFTPQTCLYTSSSSRNCPTQPDDNIYQVWRKYLSNDQVSKNGNLLKWSVIGGNQLVVDIDQVQGRLNTSYMGYSSNRVSSSSSTYYQCHYTFYENLNDIQGYYNSNGFIENINYYC